MTGQALLTAGERAARGKAARSRVPRSTHARIAPSDQRPDPVSILEEQATTRVPELVPIRHGRMAQSPFAFYRGAAAVMASDLGREPDTGVTTQLCGDAHLLNFGLFASPERRLVFDVNDFDETLPGPFEWDVKRLAASFAVAGRARGFDDKRRATIVRESVLSYRERMATLAAMRTLDIWYARDEADELQDLLPAHTTARKKAEKVTAAARGRGQLEAFAKLTHVVDGERRIVTDPPLITPLGDLLPDARREQLEGRLRGLIGTYSRSLGADRQDLLARFRVVDMARKVVGVGSVGTRCWVILLLGRDDGDPLILQAKEAAASVLAPYAGASGYPNHGQRVVSGQRLMQAASDIFLGWDRITGIDNRQRDFYVRQLRDWKGSARPDTMSANTMRAYAQLCGNCLARAHARAGDPVEIAAYLGSSDAFDRALVQYAEAYADQNERDFEAFGAALSSGRITAEAA
ncbi:DUF2252 domain-containing protein [Phytohabitans rumicis]|uniref:DUF2252 domain-containing protein n=1 Tax=Phytohabitans rumicis TaxID=1076125 RepID=A0A6V8LN80_9ACTN|nr:DUF2252 domain-containing protein [Phytohabitans rumicis]GFJ96089.1 hypothetical protein Prum_097310 [Phytohabitans rumicis]